MDLPEGDSPFCVVYCNGKAKITTLPEHGETKVITHQGKVKRVKFDEREDF
ncbi:XtrA/YqaO family protein [Halobacillus seohaensis]|uniref:XtrA/YqaO family protein n=1 Tax=Halobacillus seohaensis TaxID=447421 RepID=A0ABW2EII4_9BACI